MVRQNDIQGKAWQVLLTTQLCHVKYEEEDIFRSVLHDTVTWLEGKDRFVTSRS
jgi:hypothetical protein